MKMTLDFADVTITIDPKEAAVASPTELSTALEMVETLARSRTLLIEQTETIQQQTVAIARLIEERDALAATLAAASAHS